MTLLCTADLIDRAGTFDANGNVVHKSLLGRGNFWVFQRWNVCLLVPNGMLICAPPSGQAV